MDELISYPNISPTDYGSLYSIFVFDLSKQKERLKTGVINIKMKAQFDANVAATTQAYAVVLSDRILKFQSNGNKMSVIS